MFSYREVSCIQGEKPWVQDSKEKESVPCRDFLTLIIGFYKNFEIEGTPVICSLMKSRKVNVIFPNTAVDIFVLTSMAEEIMAQINKDWPLYIVGTAENGETVYVNVFYDNNKILVKQDSFSGKTTDILTDICFQIVCPDENSTENLMNILNDLNWKTGIIVSKWINLDFLEKNDFIVEKERKGYFCYASIQDDVTTEDYLESLSFLNKVKIWETFLKYGAASLELEWLNNKIYDGGLYNHIEWEIALWKTIELLDFSLVVKENLFQIFDSDGKRLYFSVEHNNFAEKALMKILFPLN